ncbi:rho GTPase-activating protein 100F isoform X3 [Folsomia candida]|uniref:rho GTPase-activating protein 100F isoform X3 n=1 Tax=Folsomia candida TaxID=158441 RepID=UPI001604E8C0|nr:rho GTPase-activating protein 100F isoform X3 [Folsomia candida]
MCETYDLRKSQCGSAGNCFFSRFRSISRNAKKDQGRDIPPNADQPAASPRRLQLGQFATTIPPGRGGVQQQQQQLPHMVLQPDFRKVSGISTEIFRQLESVENDHDATTAAALGAVERRGEMLVRLLDPRQFSRPVQDAVRKFLSMQDGLHSVQFVEIVKRPGQTLGLYIREGNGVDRYDGVFVSRIAIESAVFNSGCLGVGDEILAVNLVDVTHMSLDDVVILMSIPRRLVLTIRQRKGRMMSSHSMLRSESKLPPVVVMKKELDEEPYDENDENGHLLGQLGPGPYGRTTPAQVHHTLSHPGGYPGIGRGRAPLMHQQQQQQQYQTQGQRIFGAQPALGGRQGLTPLQQAQQHALGIGYGTGPGSMHSLSRHQHQSPYQPHYANLPMQHHLPDVTDYSSGRMPRHDDFRLDPPQPPIRRNHIQQQPQPSYSTQDFDPYRPDPQPPRPPSQQSNYQPYEWYRPEQEQHHREAPSTASLSYQPPPPITEQPRSSIGPQHFQPFDRAYPKTLESLAEKVHTFYTGPRPQRQQNGRRMPRTGSDHRLSLGRGGPEPQWYGSMPRQRPGSTSVTDFRSPQTAGMPPSARYSAGMSARLGVIPTRRKAPLDYASDSEAMNYPSGIRAALPAATRRSLGLTNGRSNSLPRDLIRGRGGRKHNVRFDNKRGTVDLGATSSMAGRRALLLAAGMDSQDESDGALSAPEMPLTPRREQEYRSWLTRGAIPRAPSTSAIYERLKTNRDFDLIQTQKAAKLTYSAENLTLLDRAKTRTERQLKLLTESLERENLNNLAQWEAQQRQQEQQQRPYYSYRTHLTSTTSSTLTGADSTLARALAAGRSPSTSSALAALGIREPPAGASSSLKESLSSDPLRRLVSITPSRSRDLISSVTGPGGVDGRRSPSASLLHRISADKDESLLRKEILSRSLIGRDLLSRESLKDDLAELSAAATDKSSSRLTSGPTSAAALLSVRSGGGGTTATITTPQGGGSITSTGTGDSRLKLLTINPSEFSRYKIERPAPSMSQSSSGGVDHPSATPPLTGHSGILRVHLLAGRALRSTVKTTDASIRTRDLYCVLECDRVHKARTVVCTGDQNFDWDEIFDLDLVLNKEVDFLIYSWDPQLRHRLCYKGSVNLLHVLASPNTNADNFHQLAIKVEPRGTLYVKLRHTPPEFAFNRDPKPIGLFGANVANIVLKEDSGLNVPLIVQRCIEEIERRGLDIIGLYRLCGSATKKQALREAFERSPRSVDLSAENVPDINVITGVLKDYLRELPEPLLTKSLYHMLVDALSVCLPDDPEGNARLLFSIIECLPKPNRCTLLLILEHLSLVCSLSDRNKMGPQQLAVCFGPILMIHYDMSVESVDFQPPIKVLQYLLETWPAKSVRAAGAGVEAVRKGPSLLGKGRPFPPSSSPASILLSRKQRPPTSSSASLQRDYSPQSPPSKASPSSLSESSPSPTSSVKAPHHLAMGGSAPYNNNNYPSALGGPGGYPITLTPSTTSSSLTSVTTQALTPPQTTASNYSLTSEFSTTSVTSPTPSHQHHHHVVSTSSTRESLVASAHQPPHPLSLLLGNGGGADLSGGEGSGDDVFATVSVRNRASVFETTPSNGATVLANGSAAAVAAAQHLQQQQQHQERLEYYAQLQSGEKVSNILAMQHNMMHHVTSPPHQPAVPASPFMGRKSIGGGPPLPGRAERADSFEDGGSTTTTSSNSSNNSICSKRRLPSIPKSFSTSQEDNTTGNNGNNNNNGANNGHHHHHHHHQNTPPPEHEAQQQQQPLEYSSPPSTDPDLINNRISNIPPATQQQQQYSPFQQGRQDLPQQYYAMEPSYPPPQMIKPGFGSPKPVPPPPPPKPGSAMRQRLASSCSSDSEDYSDRQDSPGTRPKQSNGHSCGGTVPNETNGGSGGSSGGSSTTTPTTVQSQPGAGSKGSSPGTTPLSTPPPVPPRLDRRPSQPSPTSSPPAMPPPVPPRLGRAAPVRTPSLDGREAFEVDCYTIKEENGEEDFLT